MTDASFERIFGMGAFEGLRVVRLWRPGHAGLAFEELASLICAVDPDAGGYDYGAARQLDPLVRLAAPLEDATEFYQHCIEAAIPAFRPVWGRVITLGRKKFVHKLSRDELQCFRVAGLLEDPPSDGIIAWWDHVAALARSQADQVRLERAREAERLSLTHESARLIRLGINAKPTWMSIEDNTAGYDIQSFDLGVDGPVNRLIEVKSTIASPLRFRLTRNEWEAARKFGDSYHFHIWDMQARQVHERSVRDVLPHIPTDNERGRWENVEIPVTDPRACKTSSS